MKPNQPDDYSRFYGSPLEKPYSDYYQSPKPIVTEPPKPKQPFSPIPLLLVAGVIFLFLGGIIFLTNTWSILSDGGRAVGLLSASVIAFGANQLAERVFRLKKTGLAFYVLGCIFLPLALCGIGVFKLFGNWLSFSGDGAYLLLSIIFLSITATTFFGQKNYQSSFMAFIFLFSTAGAWWSFSAFMAHDIVIFEKTILTVLISFYAVLCTAVSEFYLRKQEETLFTKILPKYLYLMTAFSALLMLMIAENAKTAVGLCSLILAVLFCNSRFIQGKFHLGIFGSTGCLLISASQVSGLFPETTSMQNTAFIFGITSIILMSLQQMSKLREELTYTYSHTGMILAGVVAVALSIRNVFQSLPVLWYVLLIAGAVFFFRHSEIHFSLNHLCFIATICLLFQFSILNLEGNNLFLFMLVISALLLLIQAIIHKKLWALCVAICTSISAIISGLEHADIYLLWLVAVAMLAGSIYANRTKRYFLERGCILTFLSFLTPALISTLSLKLEKDTTWILALAVTSLLYLAETFIFQKELRTNQTLPYLETESLLLSFTCFIYYLDLETSKGFGILLCLMLLIFSGVFLRKNINILALPELILSFCIVENLIEVITSDWKIVLIYTGLFLLYIAMGRLSLSRFFCQETDVFQLDCALLAGVLPLFAIVKTVDWCPSVLTCFLLAVYSLFYIGRTKNPSVPLLMVSAFSCLTLFFHNIYDPFKVLSGLHDTDMKTPEILLYLLPAHLFILSLLWIQPKKYHSGIHTARFVMYCITMLTLLITSFSFKVAADAIFLMVFSFLIVMGSFRVKRLRWFALGFSVLFLTTLRLSWTFWTSLHWGIYLFLAGAILITVASVTEYKNRYYAEHPNEPKKKFELFKEWTW